MSPEDKPMKTSAPFTASANSILGPSTAYFNCKSDSEGLSFVKSPLLLNILIFSTFTPNRTYKSVQAIAAEPAPETTTFTSSAFFPANSSALIKAAEEIIAVPC
ncbi:hypothetical protein D3C86_1548920 [compost metagenome]